MMETTVLDGFKLLESDDHGATLRLLADITRWGVGEGGGRGCGGGEAGDV
jgi:hypothetical protein